MENDKFDKDEGFCNEEILPDTPDATKALETLEQAYSDTHELDEDERYMKEALALARQAEAIDEVPVGAVVVKDGEIIASAFNTREHTKCATHHAEILAIEGACKKMGGWRLIGATLYVTMEPCAMCAGAIINARLPRVVFGARDRRFGAFGSLLDLATLPLNHTPEIRADVLGEECKEMLSSYFKKKRSK